MHEAPPSPRRSIALLPETLKNQIAAGEVVERPASVVKELAENSLDAGALRVDVAIERGGQGFIRVEDDGAGIPPEELVLAVTRHATSKIVSAQDLFGIDSFGFRGEALASVGSVARLVIASRACGREEAFALQVDGGRVGDLGPAALGSGTRVEVRDLFHNVPARLKFLKTPGSEAKRCREALFRLSLSHLEAAFGFWSDGAEVFRVPAGQTLSARLAHFWPPALCRGLHPFDHSGPAGRVHGLAGDPSQAQPRAERLLLAVNGRPVQDRMLLAAVREAYSGRLLSREYPQVALFLEVDPAEVDVNVHPAKSEVRFRDEGGIFSLVRRAVRETLDRELSGAFAVREAASAFGVSPQAAGPGGQPSLFAEPGRLPVPGSAPEPIPVPGSLAESPGREPWPGGPGIGPADPAPGSGDPGSISDGGCGFPFGAGAFREEGLAPVRETSPPAPKFSTRAAFHQAVAREVRDAGFPGAPAPATGGLELSPGLAYLGQAAGTYLVLAEAGGGLVLVDQHAAHERVLYDTIRQGRLAGDSRPLALPLELALHPAEEEVARRFWSDWARLGYRLSLEGGGRLMLRATPGSMTPGQALDALRQVLAGRTQTLEEVWISLACSQAVKAGEALAPDEALALLSAWSACPDRAYCPHGRPAAVPLGRSELERLFKRKR